MNIVDLKRHIASRLAQSIALFDDETQIIPFVNYYLEEFRNVIMKYNDSMFLVSLTLDLVANQREYDIQDGGKEIYRIRKIAANLKKDAADDDNWVILKPLRISLPVLDNEEDKIRKATKNKTGLAFYEQRGSKIFIYTDEFISITGGLLVEYYTGFKKIDLTNLNEDLAIPNSTGVGLPRELHPILVDAVSYALKTSSDKVIPLLPEEQMWEARLEDALRRNFPETQEIKPVFKIRSVFRRDL